MRSFSLSLPFISVFLSPFLFVGLSTSTRFVQRSHRTKDTILFYFTETSSERMEKKALRKQRESAKEKEKPKMLLFCIGFHVTFHLRNRLHVLPCTGVAPFEHNLKSKKKTQIITNQTHWFFNLLPNFQFDRIVLTALTSLTRQKYHRQLLHFPRLRSLSLWLKFISGTKSIFLWQKMSSTFLCLSFLRSLFHRIRYAPINFQTGFIAHRPNSLMLSPFDRIFTISPLKRQCPSVEDEQMLCMKNSRILKIKQLH